MISNPGKVIEAFSKDATIVFITKVLGAALAFIAQALLARWIGPAEYGVYAYVLGIVLLLVLPAKLGMDVMLLRFLPVYRSERRMQLSYGVIDFTRAYVLLASFAISAVCIGTTFLLSERLSVTMYYTFVVGFAILPIMSELDVNQSILRCWHRVVKGISPQIFFQPLFFGVLLCVSERVARLPITAPAAMLMYGMAFLFAFILSVMWTRQCMSRPNWSLVESDKRLWFRVALPLMIISGCTLANSRLGVVVVGSLVGTTSAGIYSVASRCSGFVDFGIVSINIAIAPIIASLYGKQNLYGIRKLSCSAALRVTGFTISSGAFFVIFGTKLLALFGKDFEGGFRALLILVIGQMITSLAGPVEYILNMTGHQKECLKIVFLSTLVNLVLSILLVPSYNVVGAACSASVGLVLWKMLMYFSIRKHLGIEPSIFGIFGRKDREEYRRVF
jgi:O-antigen/teichoic acid export membrane protein